jgi:hypothetical protein
VGVEGIGNWLGIPFLVCVVVLLFLALSDRRGVSQERLLGLGRGRIAAGYLGALCMLVLVSLWDTRNDPRRVFTILYVIVFGPVVIVLLTLIGLPMIALLRRLRFASVLGVSATGAIVTMLLGTMFEPVYALSAAYGFLIAAGFSIAARLPLLMSEPLKPDTRWTTERGN